MLLPLYCVRKYSYYHVGRFLSSVALLSMSSKLICIVDRVFLWDCMPPKNLSEADMELFFMSGSRVEAGV